MPADHLTLQITDCHLLADPDARLLGVDTAATLRAVLAHACAASTPDLLLVTGDISHDGLPQTYHRFAQLVREFYQGPVFTLPGNHDAGAALDAAFASHDFAAAHDQLTQLDLCGWCLLGLDSHADDQPEAQLPAARLATLQATLAQIDVPALLALHHPLLPVGAPWLDKDCVPGGPALLEWLATQSTVRGVLFGHVHQAIDAQYRQLKLWGTPSTCFQFAPRSEGFTVDQRQPGYRWITLSNDGAIRTQVQRLRDFPLHIQL
ncbi:MAG: metallophosphoesterase [Pseudomonadales bacterium]